MLEHVPYPMRVAAEIGRTLKPGGLAFIQVPFLENVHGWPDDYYRFTLRGLRVLFSDLEEVASGVSAGLGRSCPIWCSTTAWDSPSCRRAGCW